jgi:hypothetical protein
MDLLTKRSDQSRRQNQKKDFEVLTVSEIDGAIRSKRRDMDQAISEKRFADAELIDKEVSDFEK